VPPHPPKLFFVSSVVKAFAELHHPPVARYPERA
jgi:hypothetical protein